jgi:hypothetical protein
VFLDLPTELPAEPRRRPLDGAEMWRFVEVACLDHLLKVEFR